MNESAPKRYPESIPVVFTPANEPYLGRELLFHFDQLIASVLETNTVTAPRSHVGAITDHQRMACAVIPQALSIALLTRELIRQGYLFGAHVLLRALVERAAILLYFHLYPGEIDKWNRGWCHPMRPDLRRCSTQSKISGNASPVFEEGT